MPFVIMEMRPHVHDSPQHDSRRGKVGPGHQGQFTDHLAQERLQLWPAPVHTLVQGHVGSCIGQTTDAVHSRLPVGGARVQHQVR